MGKRSIEAVDGSLFTFVYRWGTQSYYTPSFPDNLQTANVSVVPRDVCESQYGAELITSRMVCPLVF